MSQMNTADLSVCGEAVRAVSNPKKRILLISLPNIEQVAIIVKEVSWNHRGRLMVRTHVLVQTFYSNIAWQLLQAFLVDEEGCKEDVKSKIEVAMQKWGQSKHEGE
jgi:hypothetical protein